MEEPLQHSRIGLVGSGEFTAAMADIDRDILATIGPAPTVVVLPTAAAGEDPEDWALRGVDHFVRLGARSVALMVLAREHAEDPENVRVIEQADLLYISGGKTAGLLDALEGSPLWRGFLLARQAGAWLVGSSAGAMARSEEHTSELQSHSDLVCCLMLEKKNKEVVAICLIIVDIQVDECSH